MLATNVMSILYLIDASIFYNLSTIYRTLAVLDITIGKIKIKGDLQFCQDVGDLFFQFGGVEKVRQYMKNAKTQHAKL